MSENKTEKRMNLHYRGITVIESEVLFGDIGSDFKVQGCLAGSRKTKEFFLLVSRVLLNKMNDILKYQSHIIPSSIDDTIIATCILEDMTRATSLVGEREIIKFIRLCEIDSVIYKNPFSGPFVMRLTESEESLQKFRGPVRPLTAIIDDPMRPDDAEQN